MSDQQTNVETKYALQAQRTEFELSKLNDKYEEHVELFKSHTEDDKKTNQTHIDILTKVSDQVEFTQKCLDNLNNKLELSTQKLQSEIEKINHLDEQQNKILDEHIAGVNTLKDILAVQKEEVRLLEKSINLKITALEKPAVWLSTTSKVLLAFGAAAGAVTLILKLIEKFNG